MMAISVEHLGAQVQCPHCSAVVQTPPRSSVAGAMGSPPPGPDPAGAAVQPPQPPAPPPPPSPPPAYTPNIQIPERESIFGEPEPSDDLFDDGGAQPKVMMPEPAAVSISEGHYASGNYAEPEVVSEPEHHEEAEEQADLSGMRSRLAAERKASSVAPTMLVFLIPYAIFTTAFIAYLLYMWPKIERFDYLPDPNSKSNKTRTVLELPKHDLKLADANKVAFNQPFQRGEMEITPLKVFRDGKDLSFDFKAKNVSTRQIIVPIDREFFDDGKSMGTARPYTFLAKADGKDTQGERVYAFDVEYFKGPQMVRMDNPELKPGEECIVRLTTAIGDRDRKRVAALLAEDGRYQWRLQFRRGLTPIHGSELSMTAVVGVEFGANDITKQ